MTNDQLLTIYNNSIGISQIAALRSVWNAGYYDAKGVTPSASTKDASINATAPTTFVTPKKK